jgi:UDP-2,3-diacylglucosamine hydrolase
MSHSLLISDLHLSSDHPRSTELFLRFTAEVAPKAEALFILGDLFEYWAGDDDLGDPFHQYICNTLRKLDANGTRIFIMHGNRDFLMDKELGSACNATLLDDPTMIDLYGTPTLLTHGDTLCTDDTEYQRFREQVRDKAWQAQFLSQPLAQRKAQIEQLRQQSESEKRGKEMALMDVNIEMVNELLRQNNYPRLIHGHTHRPAKHLHQVDGHTCTRWVLGDWGSKAIALRCDRNGIQWADIPV